MTEEEKREAVYTADCALAIMQMANELPTRTTAKRMHILDDGGGPMSGCHFYVTWQDCGDKQRVMACQEDHTEDGDEDCHPLLAAELYFPINQVGHFAADRALSDQVLANVMTFAPGKWAAELLFCSNEKKRTETLTPTLDGG